MNMDLLKPLLGGIVRHALTTLGGILVAQGVMQSSDVNGFIGAGMVIAGIAWSWWQKVGQAQIGDLLKKLTSKPTVQAATDAAKMAPTGAAVKVIALIAVLILGSLIAATPGHAQLKRPAITGHLAADIVTDLKGGTVAKPSIAGVTLTGDVTKDGPKIWAEIVSASSADLAYASAMAAAAGTPASKTRKQCWDAIIAVNQQASGGALKNPDGTPMVKPDPHLFTDAESVAEVIDNLSPQGPLFTSCAGAAQLAKMNTLALINGLVTGAAAFTATGGLVP